MELMAIEVNKYVVSSDVLEIAARCMEKNCQIPKLGKKNLESALNSTIQRMYNGTWSFKKERKRDGKSGQFVPLQIKDTYYINRYEGPVLPTDWKAQLKKLWINNNTEKIVTGVAKEVNFVNIKAGTLSKWTRDFIEYGAVLLSDAINSQVTVDPNNVIIQNKAFFKYIVPGGKLNKHIDPCQFGSVVYVIEETGCKNKFEIHLEEVKVEVENYVAGNTITLLPNTIHEVLCYKTDSGSHSSKSERFVVICFY